VLKGGELLKMKELLEYIVKNIVSKPDAVKIDEQKTADGVLLNLSVDKEDMGVVIGKEGRIIRAIRSLVRIKAIRDGVRVDLELLEPEGGKFERKEEDKIEPVVTEEAPKEEDKEEKKPAKKEAKKKAK
jgi:predicted RNA-binding protein YlqC (UPF0109 family)